MSFAINDGGGFLVIPSPNALGDKAFMARGTIGYHIVDGDRFPFAGSFRYGLFDAFELGLHFGSAVSLEAKNQLRASSGLFPAVAVGARAFVQSPEAYFYSVPKSERKNQTGEFYAAVGWDSDWWGLSGGVSAFPAMDADAVAPFWGFEQKFGKHFSILYEGFFRHGYSHHNGCLLLKPVKSLQISAGATEFYRYLLTEDGDFKFRDKNPSASNGYRTPGIYASIAIIGSLGKSYENKESADLRKRVSYLETLLGISADTSAADSNARGTAHNIKIIDAKDGTKIIVVDAEKVNYYSQDILSEFEEIVRGYFITDMDLDSLRAKEELFMSKGLMSINFALNESQNKETTQNSRVTAIRIMSHFPDSMFIEPLGNIATDSTNETIAREAALALGTINTPEARKMLSIAVNKTSGAVRKTIMDILGEL